MTEKTVIVGVDTGGTFTDFVVLDGGIVRIHKESSSPDNPAEAVVTGLHHLIGDVVADIVHGSTVATNALLERKGARTALITTAGFEDVIEIGRQARSAIYDLHVSKPPPLVSAELRMGVDERIGPDGEVITPLNGAALDEVVRWLGRCEPDSVAICFLHSYANPNHERTILEGLRDAGVFVTASHDVLPEFREYERCTTTVVNAYVGPVMAGYLGSLSERLGSDSVRIMQSNGGILSLRAAQRFAVQTILSGPAGGAVGGFEIGKQAGFENIITFDMGGTSTDVSLCDGALSRTSETLIGEMPIRVPVIDIHTVGAGGGSIAYRDPGGSLRVGPRSAGARPGPICCDRGGTDLTVTDANLFLGRLSPAHFLGGTKTLPTEPVQHAMNTFAQEMRLSASQAADGILKVANATMERAIRVISLERGYDPHDFTLVCFGGAGAMHAADLARNLNMPRVLVPQNAGILSALGMLMADFVRDYSHTVLLPTAGIDRSRLDLAFDDLETRAQTEFAAEGLTDDRLTLQRSVDMRYIGQGYELSVEMQDDIDSAFHDRHRQRYGYADPGRPTEIVHVRLRAVARNEKPVLPYADAGGPDASAAIIGELTMSFEDSEHAGQLVDRSRLKPGNAFTGPALVIEYSTTTVVPPDFSCRVDPFENLILEQTGDQP